MATVHRANQDGVAILTIDHPPVNALSGDVLRALGEQLNEASEDRDVRAIVLTGAGQCFVAGADIARLESIARGRAVSKESPLGDLIARLEAGPKPSVAAINGVALGGGLELAMACNERIASTRARIGLPELALGLIPGAGGTQRLPRLIGLEAAIGVMLDSSQLSASDALAQGALAEVCAPESLLDRARAIALEIADGKREKRQSLQETSRLVPSAAAREIIARARAGAARRFRNVPHAEACLDAILTGIEHGPERGLARERELFEQLLASDSARGLIHVFFAERAVAKLPGVTDIGLEPRPIRRVLVLGGGTMGSGIATALLGAGVSVLLSEVDSARAEAARERVTAQIERGVSRGRTPREAADAMLGRFETQSGWQDATNVELVIEAASEDLELKRRLFAELGRATSPNTILCSNTSTIDIDELAGAAGAPERVLGLHFFSPAQVMKLVEVVRTPSLGAQALVDVLALCKRMKKTAVTVKSRTGFLVNRIFMPYGQIAGFLIDRGVDPYRIDRALTEFGMPMGPCRMSDLAGIDVGLSAGAILDAAYPDRSYRSPLRRLLVEAGRLGEKSARGHYLYRDGAALPDPELEGFVARARELAGNPEPMELDDGAIVELCLFGVVNEACRTLEENVVLRASDVDVASILGMGFPAYRGGVLAWADAAGPQRAHALLEHWHAQTGLGLFRPSARLGERARSGAPLGS